MKECEGMEGGDLGASNVRGWSVYTPPCGPRAQDETPDIAITKVHGFD